MLSQKDFIRASFVGVGFLSIFGTIATGILTPVQIVSTPESRGTLLLLAISALIGLLPFALIPSFDSHQGKTKMKLYAVTTAIIGLTAILIGAIARHK